MKMKIWDKIFKNGPSKICGRQPLKNLKGYGLLRLSFTNFTWFIRDDFAPYVADLTTLILREKGPNTEFFLGPYFPVFGPEKLCYWTLFTQTN